MDTVFMNHKNSETSDPYRFIDMLLYETIAYTIHENKNVIQKQ